MNYQQRLSTFQQRLSEVADLAFFPRSSDLQYLTGVPREIPNFGSVIHPGDWLEGAWLTPTIEPMLALPRMTAEFGGLASLKGITINLLNDFDDPKEMLKAFLKKVDLPKIPRIAIGKSTRGETVTALHELLPNATFVSATDLVRPLRAIKSEDEIDTMRKAGAMTEAAFADVLKTLKHGMTELELVSEVDYQLRKHGSLGPSFTTSLYNSGPNHPLVFGQPEVTWKRVLNPPVSILFDFGAIFDGYCYDYGRTVFFGEPTSSFQKIFKLIMTSQETGIAAMKAGQVSAAEVDKQAREVISSAGYGETFRHRLGHAIGVDVHEPPFLTKTDNTVLQERMLFTVEPSITQFDTFSCRVEDVVVVRPDGGEPLTKGFRELLVIE